MSSEISQPSYQNINNEEDESLLFDDQQTYTFHLRGNRRFNIKRKTLKIFLSVVTVITNLMLVISTPMLLGKKGKFTLFIIYFFHFKNMGYDPPDSTLRYKPSTERVLNHVNDCLRYLRGNCTPKPYI